MACRVGRPGLGCVGRPGLGCVLVRARLLWPDVGSRVAEADPCVSRAGDGTLGFCVLLGRGPAVLGDEVVGLCGGGVQDSADMSWHNGWWVFSVAVGTGVTAGTVGWAGPRVWD